MLTMRRYYFYSIPQLLQVSPEKGRSLGYKQKSSLQMYVTRIFVIPKRFERLTHALEGRCSIQLSYGTYLLCKSWAQPHLRLQR